MLNRKQLIAVGCSAITCAVIFLFVLWPDQPQVTGLVMLDDVALPGATVLFTPVNEPDGVDSGAVPGFAMTDRFGVYTVHEELRRGTYCVVVRPSLQPESNESGFSEFDSVQREAMMAGRHTAKSPVEFQAGVIAVSGSATIDGDFMIQSDSTRTPEKLAVVPFDQR